MKITIESPFETRSGYGARSRDIIKSILNQYKDSELNLISLPWGNTSFIDVPELKQYKVQTVDNNSDIYIHVGIPNETKPKGKFNILVTAGIETDLVSREWISGCNNMDLIIVPSQHSKNVFENSFYPMYELQKPIEVLFEGVDTNIYKKTNELEEKVNNLQFDSKFNFLFIGTWLPGDFAHDRKDVGMLIKWFSEAFNNQKQVGLILKLNIGALNEINKEILIDRIKKIKGKSNAPIYLLYGDYTDEQMNSLYNREDIKSFISFTHGEGWGRDGIQFLTSEKKVILPNFSGHLDYCTESNSILLEGQLEQVHNSALYPPLIIQDSKWFRVNYDKVGQKILSFINSENKTCEFDNKFSLDNMKIELKSIIDRYICK